MNRKINKQRKGFTLIELLVVIAIIAVLAVVVILTLNPAELLRQARDSNRISDMATMKSAISLYLADQTTPNLANSAVSCGGPTGYNCIYISNGTPTGTNIGAAASSGISTIGVASTVATTSRSINGTGWIPVNFSLISSGAPIGNLPVDPVNATNSVATYGGGMLIYGYVATTTSLGFKLTAHMESSKYGGGTADVEGPDGGISATTYEQGTNLAL